MNLTSEQQEVVDCPAPTMVVKACPGAGKTTMLVELATAWIRRDRVDPAQLLIMTYTRKAAQEVRERLFSRLSEDAINIRVGTFHSICFSIVRAWYEQLGFPSRNIMLADDMDADSILKGLLRLVRDVSITDAHRALAGAPDATQEAKRVALRYREKMRGNCCADYSMLISEVLSLLESEHGDEVRALGRYILVDEAQDTDARQHDFYQALNPKRLVIVGDVDQLIYDWRGADPMLMDRVLQVRQGELLHLTLNHRSTKEIVGVAERVRRMMRAQGPPQQWVRQDHGLCTTIPAEGLAEAVAAEAGTVGILCRTNAQATSATGALLAGGIACAQIGRNRVQMEHPLVRGAFAYLSLPYVTHGVLMLDRIAKLEGWHSLVLPTILSKAKAWGRASGGVFAIALKEVHQFKEFYRDFTGDPVADAGLCMIRMKERLGQEDPAAEDAFMASIKEYARTAGPDGDLADMLAYAIDGGGPDVTDRVQVMTVHAAKGLEFDAVYVVGLQDRMWPRTPGDVPALRLLYVAATRARSRLFFVTEGPSQCLDDLRPYLL